MHVSAQQPSMLATEWSGIPFKHYQRGAFYVHYVNFCEWSDVPFKQYQGSIPCSSHKILANGQTRHSNTNRQGKWGASRACHINSHEWSDIPSNYYCLNGARLGPIIASTNIQLYQYSFNFANAFFPAVVLRGYPGNLPLNVVIGRNRIMCTVIGTGNFVKRLVYSIVGLWDNRFNLFQYR